MAAAPAAAAVWADVLWCLGIGCLLWAVRDGAELLLGRGPVRCFVLDLLAFTAGAVLLVGFSAGVSAAGLARWYMAAGMAAGALAWQKAIVPPLHRALNRLLRWLLAPARWAHRRIAVPLRAALQIRVQNLQTAGRVRRQRKKAAKTEKSAKKQLQKPSKVLYN